MGESRIENILEATINGDEYTEPSGSRIETLLIELNELIIEGGRGGSSTAYATALSLTINSSTYVMTAQLLNKDGDPLGTAQTVDLPLESVVVGATYDNTTKSIILTLQSGSTTSVPVGDLVAGLVSTSDLETALATKQATIDSSHKLDADLVDDTDSTNKFVTAADKTAWNNKQDALTFDSTPTSESTNPVTSGGVYTALEEKLDILPSSSLVKIGMPEIKSETGLKGYVTLYSLGVTDAATNKIALIINSFSNDISLSIARTGVLIYKLDATRQASDVNADNMIVENKETLGLVDGGRNNENRYSPNVSNNIDGVPYSVVLRPYVKLSDNTYVYGDIIETSYTEVATKYPDYTISSLPVQAATGISFTMRWNIDDTKTISEMGMIYASGEYDRIDNSTPNTTTIPVPALCNHGMCSNIISDNGDGVSMVGYCIVDGVTYYTDTVTGYYNELVKLSLGPNYLELKLDDTTARIEALENAPAPSGMTYDTLYEGTTASSYPYPLSHPITDYKFVIIAVGYSNVYTNNVIPVAVWSTVTSGGGNYDITVDTAQLKVNASEIVPRSANNRIVYGVYGIK